MDKFSYKLILVGGESVGKTTFSLRHRSGEFLKEYSPTLGVEAHPIRLSTNVGEVCFNTWDCSGNSKYKGLGEGYYIDAKCVLIFFDVNSMKSFLEVEGYLKSVRKMCGDYIPIVVVGNKADLAKREVKYKVIKRKLVQIGISLDRYVEYSCKSNYHFEQPFIRLLKDLFDQDVKILDLPTLVEPSPTLEDYTQNVWGKLGM